MREPTPSWLSNVYNISSSSSLLSFKLYSPPLQQLFYSGAVLSASQMGGPKRHHHPTSGELFLARVFLSSFFLFHSFFIFLFFPFGRGFQRRGVYTRGAHTWPYITGRNSGDYSARVNIYYSLLYVYQWQPVMPNCTVLLYYSTTTTIYCLFVHNFRCPTSIHTIGEEEDVGVHIVSLKVFSSLFLIVLLFNILILKVY